MFAILNLSWRVKVVFLRGEVDDPEEEPFSPLSFCLFGGEALCDILDGKTSKMKLCGGSSLHLAKDFGGVPKSVHFCNVIGAFPARDAEVRDLVGFGEIDYMYARAAGAGVGVGRTVSVDSDVPRVFPNEPFGFFDPFILVGFLFGLEFESSKFVLCSAWDKGRVMSGGGPAMAELDPIFDFDNQSRNGDAGSTGGVNLQAGLPDCRDRTDDKDHVSNFETHLTEEEVVPRSREAGNVKVDSCAVQGIFDNVAVLEHVLPGVGTITLNFLAEETRGATVDMRSVRVP